MELPGEREIVCEAGSQVDAVDGDKIPLAISLLFTRDALDDPNGGIRICELGTVEPVADDHLRDRAEEEV
ncbi:hypothetical protein [Gordonia humi]|uniref:Uncharacterized protein n=1 Tax=Gordonia humi TaxID=686429 RepID=A0A840EMJ1_9ACTN|nr:hypothetical protein [Gordonia humi]MBB4134005.1 hypothetical protein [Gordonia humi]